MKEGSDFIFFRHIMCVVNKQSASVTLLYSVSWKVEYGGGACKIYSWEPPFTPPDPANFFFQYK